MTVVESKNIVQEQKEGQRMRRYELGAKAKALKWNGPVQGIR